MILTIPQMNFGHWCIFLTHWGVILITITSGSAALLSLKVCIGDPNRTSTDLQLYVKIYWVLYNITVPLAVLITAFYWTFLTGADVDFAVDPVLDVFIHAVNAVVMIVLVVFSRTPSRLLHFLHPLGFGIIYVIFSVIYYAAGGLSPFGAVYIYPMLDWSSPGIAMITVVGSAIFLILGHVLIVLIALGRDKLSNRFFKDTHSMNIYSDAYN
ncbi:hypothetical protein O3G_MSEX006643 [Manduca sexta]|uniref:Protein rolling stone-like n=2 Tax=Manduca sexta TaxID=7130 RepID=A0A921Z301_MANSE|nr:hypothetical protein O3G_MSEX006643 [Manduca sexta]